MYAFAIEVSTNIWQFVDVLPVAKISENCNICLHCLIQNDVVVGDRVTVISGVQLWGGLGMGGNVVTAHTLRFTTTSILHVAMSI